jgi:hypothetical protein
MLETLNEFILRADPWWVIFFALVLIAIDWIFINSEVFLVIGIAALKLSVTLFIFDDVQQIAWLVPVFLFTSFFFQRKLFNGLISSKLPDENLNFVGQKGIIKKYSNENHSNDVFFNYEASIEPKADVSIETANVILSDGRQLTIANPGGFQDGDTVKIVTHNNGVATVKGV